MSYRDLIEVSVDFGNLEERLGEIDSKIENIEALDEDGVQALIDNAIESIDGFVSTDDFDADDSESRLREVESNVGDHEDRLRSLESASPSSQDDQAQAIELLRQRVEELSQQVVRAEQTSQHARNFLDLVNQAIRLLLTSR